MFTARVFMLKHLQQQQKQETPLLEKRKNKVYNPKLFLK